MSEEKETHWIDNDKIRKAFWAYCKNTLGLDESEVYEALNVTSIHDFTGDKDMAKALLNTYAETLDDRRLIKSLVAQDAAHAEACAIAFCDMFTKDGTRIAVTAREGATADDVALTALALWYGCETLMRLGWTTAAENGKAAVETLALKPEAVPINVILDTSIATGDPPPPPTSTAPPVPTEQEQGNGGGELLTEFVKITAPKGKPVIEFWRPNRKYREIPWYLGGEAFLKQVAPTLAKAGWTADHFDAVGKEYTLPLKIVWIQSPKDAKYKDITEVTLR